MNEKTESVHICKEFTGELGKDMWIRSYFMRHGNNYLSGKKYQK